ncbi:MAG: hypothetical protein M1835_003006 [Candelina submexicana]|nr:MAG: hypothetical protein M1835_003006 [Candelina submexicana]
MAFRVAIPFLVAMMLLTGVCNTLLTKYQDLQCVKHCNSSDPSKRKLFEQPVIQTLQMFIGESGCWLVVALISLYNTYISPRLPNKDSNNSNGGDYQPLPTSTSEDSDPSSPPTTPIIPPPTTPAITALPPSSHPETRASLHGRHLFLLALPSTCDILGTTLMNVGLLFVAASIYQMTRGALVLFVGLFSVLFLHHRLRLYQWSALFIVVLGVAIVGLAGAIAKDPQKKPLHPLPGGGQEEEEGALPLLTIRNLASSASKEAYKTASTPAALQTIIGVLLIAFAQVFTATQFVLEEWILEHYALEPLSMVGWEGVFGSAVTLIGMIILHYAIGQGASARGDESWRSYFDMEEGWRQVKNYPAIAVSSLLIMISIGGFNFFGLSVTRSVSSTSRSTIDTCRTLFIWIVSLGLGWETFKWLQILGFALLVYGTFLFNDIVKTPGCLRRAVGRRGTMGGRSDIA